MEFPIFNTKELSDGNTYNLSDPVERRKYFEAKLGSKIDKIKEYLDNNTFVGFMLGKKMGSKGTFSKMFQEVIGQDRVALISVGDVVRVAHTALEEDTKEGKEIREYLEKHYRGFISLEDAINALLGRSQKKLIPTEIILVLVKREIEKVGRKAVFIDGLPRDQDQVSYSLYFRDLINFRDDPDFFVIISVPETVLNSRMKFRRVCPKCHVSRNTKFLLTKFIEYDEDDGEFYLLCDNSDCEGFEKERLVGKEGDQAGIESVRERINREGQVMETAYHLQGIPKVLIRNSVPVSEVKENMEEYELTPEYSFDLDNEGKVKVIEKPWIVKDDDGVDSHSMLAAPAVVSMISQVYDILLG